MLKNLLYLAFVLADTWIPTQPPPQEILDSSLSFDFKRTLYDNIDDIDLKSNTCKVDCIDEGLNFCATADYTKGFCCRIDETCPRGSICSNDNPKAPLFFKYLACPNEMACESKEITPSMDGTELKRVVDKYEYKFV